jgi:cobalt/nickel transport system permease protein
MSLCALFSDIFARQDNGLARLDPRTKLIVAGAALLCLLGSGHPGLPLALFVCCAAATVAVGVPLRQLALRLAAPLAMVGTAVALRWWLQVATLQSGGVLVVRVLGGVSVVLLLSAATPAHRIFHALRALGMPRGWVEVALLMYRYIFILLDLAADMTAAQKVRLGYADLRRGWTSAGAVAGTLILRSVDQAVRAHEAMRVRGYRGELPFGPLPGLARRDWLVLAGALLLLGGAYWGLACGWA